jgi:hypothetical protein
VLATSPSFAQTIFISVITSGVVAAVVTGAFKLTEQSRQHAHERKRQLREERKAIYPAAVDVIEQTMHNLAQLELHGPLPPGGVQGDEAARRDLALQMAVFASPEVYSLLGQFFLAAKEYAFSLGQHAEGREQQAGSETLRLLWQNVEKSRGRMRELEARLTKRIRRELETL